MKNTNKIDARALRIKTGLNQSKFWTPLGVTQSCGSRYESGRPIPEPVRKLLVIGHGTDKQSAAEVEKVRPGPVADPVVARRIAQQRDELLAALKCIVDSLSEHDDEGMVEHTQQMIAAREAIARAEDSKP